MFGFQRVGDQLWAAGDSRAKGFVMGATAGRTTLNGEGLQHQDGQGLLFASVYPSCLAYDPTFSYEVAVLIQKGIERMFARGEEVFYYITLLNENYPHPEMPKGVEEGIDRGMYLYQKGEKGELKVQLMGSGSILREVIGAADLLAKDFGVQADVWSILGVNQLHREGMLIEDWNRNHPKQPGKKSYVEQQLEGHEGPVVISTDYVQAYAEQLRRFIPRPLTILGTDGYGRSDSREVLRRFFQIDRYHLVAAALKNLADEGKLSQKTVSDALSRYAINPDEPHALTR
jgi:pyruvate dehydrogenase E1 component